VLFAKVSVGVFDAPFGRFRPLLDTRGFVAVPATAGPVIVAAPLVAPVKVSVGVCAAMPAVTLVVPRSVVNVPAAAAVPPIGAGDAR
jgi:hypothetical protein